MVLFFYGQSIVRTVRELEPVCLKSKLEQCKCARTRTSWVRIGRYFHLWLLFPTLTLMPLHHLADNTLYLPLKRFRYQMEKECGIARTEVQAD